MLFIHLLQNPDICWFLYFLVKPCCPYLWQSYYSANKSPVRSIHAWVGFHIPELCFLPRNDFIGVGSFDLSHVLVQIYHSWCHFQNAIEKTHHCVTAEFPLWRVFGNWFEQPSHSGALSARNGLDAVMFSFIFNSSSENYTRWGHRSLRTPGIGQT